MAVLFSFNKIETICLNWLSRCRVACVVCYRVATTSCRRDDDDDDGVGWWLWKRYFDGRRRRPSALRNSASRGKVEPALGCQFEISLGVKASCFQTAASVIGTNPVVAPSARRNYHVIWRIVTSHRKKRRRRLKIQLSDGGGGGGTTVMVAGIGINLRANSHRNEHAPNSRTRIWIANKLLLLRQSKQGRDARNARAIYLGHTAHGHSIGLLVRFQLEVTVV